MELKNDIVNCTLLKNKTLDYLIFDSPYFLNSSIQNKNLINKMNTNFTISKEKGFNDLSLKELIKYMEKYVTKGEVITLQFKC